MADADCADGDADPIVLDPSDPAFAVAADLPVCGPERAMNAAHSAPSSVDESSVGTASRDILAVLGTSAVHGHTKPAPMVTQHLLRDLHAFALARLAAGNGVDALRSVGITNPDLVAAYRIGYLPADFRSALNKDQRLALAGKLRANALLVPAYDEQGNIVDLMAVSVDETCPAVLTVHDSPRGLIAPAVATACDEVVVTDSLRRAARHAAGGRANVLLLRGAEDAAANAARLRTGGVRTARLDCHRNGTAIAAALAAAGITVLSAAGGAPVAPTLPKRDPLHFPTVAAAKNDGDEDPGGAAPPAAALPEGDAPAVRLTDHDRRTATATFLAGALTYTAEVPWDERTVVEVQVARGEDRHRDRLDLNAEPQRRRFAECAGLRVGAPAGSIARNLEAIAGLLADLVADAEAPTASAPLSARFHLTDADRAAALELSRAPDLLDRVVADLGALGWVDDASAKRLAFLASVSRMLHRPVWLALTTDDPACRHPGLDVIAEATPPEDLIQATRLSDAALLYADSGALTRKVLVLDDARALSPAAATSLVVMHQRGGISTSRVERDPLTGVVRTAFQEVQGPLAVVAGGLGGTRRDDAHAALLSRFVEVAADDGPAHLARLMAEERRQLATAPRGTDAREGARQGLRNLQRVLEPCAVVVPFAESIRFPALSAHSRRDQDLLLGLISASAALHQHQRLRDQGCLIATRADFDVAAALVNERLAAGATGLGAHARHITEALARAGLTNFRMADLDRLLPDRTRYACLAGLEELTRLGYVTRSGSGRGKPHAYHLHLAAPDRAGDGCDPASRITLSEVGELATVVDDRSDNSTPTGRVG